MSQPVRGAQTALKYHLIWICLCVCVCVCVGECVACQIPSKIHEVYSRVFCRGMNTKHGYWQSFVSVDQRGCYRCDLDCCLGGSVK